MFKKVIDWIKFKIFCWQVSLIGRYRFCYMHWYEIVCRKLSTLWPNKYRYPLKRGLDAQTGAFKRVDSMVGDMDTNVMAKRTLSGYYKERKGFFDKSKEEQRALTNKWLKDYVTQSHTQGTLTDDQAADLYAILKETETKKEEE